MSLLFILVLFAREILLFIIYTISPSHDLSLYTSFLHFTDFSLSPSLPLSPSLSLLDPFSLGFIQSMLPPYQTQLDSRVALGLRRKIQGQGPWIHRLSAGYAESAIDGIGGHPSS